MATLAAMLKAKGFEVRGSDQGVYPPMSDFLEAQGITILEGYRQEHITADLDLVVVGNAVSRGNPEVEEVLDRKIRYCSLPEAVRDHFLWAARSIVVAGTHGKTTTTSLAGWLLVHGGLDPNVLVGGIAENFDSSFRIGGGRDFVIEGDEYDSAFFDKTAKFLKYVPDIVVVGNVEFDHADIYPDLEAIRVAFRRLVNLIPRQGLLLTGADNPEAAALAGGARCRVQTFGFVDGADWQAYGVRVEGARTTFGLRRRGASFGTFEVPLLGAHNVRNAAAAVAIGAAVGLDAVALAEGLRQFRGVRRRLEHRGQAGGVDVYDDFAHHPTAIAETLKGVRSAFPDRRVWAVFEPRSATSCRRVFQADFARAFEQSGADEVIVAAVYRSSLPENERLSPETLVRDLKAAGVSARHVATVPEIVETVRREARAGDLIVVMSNGGFDDIHRKLLDALEKRA
jgi:UDP-N-acetylmuramate: L-alanyl-gamma-D-glutamyl-meso-diaminopimelate ligase